MVIWWPINHLQTVTSSNPPVTKENGTNPHPATSAITSINLASTASELRIAIYVMSIYFFHFFINTK